MCQRRSQKVRPLQQVTTLTMGLAAILCSNANASMDIRSISHDLQMVGIYTSPDAAKMIDHQAGRDRLTEYAIGPPSHPRRGPSNACLRVTLIAEPTSPYPAGLIAYGFGKDPEWAKWIEFAHPIAMIRHSVPRMLGAGTK